MNVWHRSSHVQHMRSSFHISAMIQIRNVPEALHRELKSRAALAGMSLSDYLLNETRKGAGTSYIGHLLGAASIVLEHGGDEEQAMAGMLHDAVEDQGAHQADAITQRFGPRVAAIVLGCTS